MGNILYYLVGVSFLGMAYSFWKYYQMTKMEAGVPNSVEIAKTIKNGTIRYIETESKILLLFAVSMGLLLFFKGQAEHESNGFVVLSYIVGAGISVLAGYLGMRLSTIANVLTSNESRISFGKGFQSSVSGSASVGLTNASLLIVGMSLLLITYDFVGKEWSPTTILNVLAGFALGASTVSLFLRFGGGLFAKSAERADSQLQSTEAGIRSNSLLNPASSANDIGQSVANVGGINADLFDSLAASLIASMILGLSFLESENIMDRLPFGPMLVPLAIAAVGILTSVGAIFILNASDNKEAKKITDISEAIAAIALALAAFFVTRFLLPAEWNVVKENGHQITTTTYYSLGIFWCAVFGIGASVAIGKISPLFTSEKTKSIQATANESTKGTDSNLLAGIQNGLISIGLPVALIILVSIISYRYAGFYGLGIAAVGMLSNMGFYSAISAFAPISDNANTIAIKAKMSDETVNQSGQLKQFGYKNLANSRNFLVVATALTSITLFSAFVVHSGIELVNLSKPLVIAGTILGAVLPFILSSTTLSSIVRISKKMTTETKRQFTEILPLSHAKGVLDKYNGDLTYATEGEKEIVFSAVDDVNTNQLVEISTYSTIWETVIPGGIAIAITALLGFFAGIEILSGFLMGAVSSGILLSLFFANSGNTWESTKTAFEDGIKINGEVQSQNSPGYQSAVIGDKAGRPMKDAISPAISVIIKLILVTAIVCSASLINRELSKKGLHVENKSKTEIHFANHI